MKTTSIAKCAFAMLAAGGVVTAAWLLRDPPSLPVPKHPYRDVSQCADPLVDVAIFDADRDPFADLALLCGGEVVAASGFDGDSLWRYEFARGRLAVLRLRDQPFVASDGRGNLVAAHDGTIASLDVATGQARWSWRGDARVSGLKVGGGCVAAELDNARGALVDGPLRLSADRGEPSTCEADSPVHGGEYSASLKWQDPPEGADRGRDVVRLSRHGIPAWSLACDLGICRHVLTPAGVILSGHTWSGNWDDRGVPFARLHDLSTGQVVRELEPADMDWRFRHRPPYIIASHGFARPVIEVFSDRSLVTRWRTDPDDPPVIWKPVGP